MTDGSAARVFLLGCELHDAQRMASALDSGLDAREPLDGRRLVTWLLEMYTRSDRFAACLRLLLDRGATIEDDAVLPVLLDDPDAIRRRSAADATWLTHRTTLPSAFTPLDGASLLHVAAEFGHVEAARTLIALGAEVDARAATDGFGLGGHTPLFHTVNSHANRSEPVMRLLLDAGASVEARVAGLTWGGGLEWETTLFDVTPIGYAQCGLLPQMHRDPTQIAGNIRSLLAAAGRLVPPMPNVPNRYAVRAATPRSRPPTGS